jgi:predicted RNase H-like HicB family nuclease
LKERKEPKNPKLPTMKNNHRPTNETEAIVSVADVGYICIFQRDTKDCYHVTCPKLPSVITYGKSIEQAQAAAQEEVETCLMSLYDNGQYIPEPDCVPSWRFGLAHG